VNKAVDDNVTWSCGGVMEVALHDNMILHLHIYLATRGGVREKILTVLTNGGMAYGHAGEMGTQCIGKPYGGEL